MGSGECRGHCHARPTRLGARATSRPCPIAEPGAAAGAVDNEYLAIAGEIGQVCHGGCGWKSHPTRSVKYWKCRGQWILSDHRCVGRVIECQYRIVWGQRGQGLTVADCIALPHHQEDVVSVKVRRRRRGGKGGWNSAWCCRRCSRRATGGGCWCHCRTSGCCALVTDIHRLLGLQIDSHHLRRGEASVPECDIVVPTVGINTPRLVACKLEECVCRSVPRDTGVPKNIVYARGPPAITIDVVRNDLCSSHHLY